ncbi:MAG: gliding motility-associated C-terminal domain-containing protein [Bacteroidetes bacterium]|nr:gliding motility-associated C-terminal domain-containing protein [Bacteroidota bacterium]
MINNKPKPKKKILSIVFAAFLLFFGIDSNKCVLAQNVFVNNGLNIVSNSNLHINIIGGIINLSGGKFDNSGTINLYGDWENKAGNTGFVNSSPGKVKLKNANQSIRGTDITHFHDLILQGTGIKSLVNIDAIVEDSLVLNDREFAADVNTLFVTNPSQNIITRSTGFVSSLNNGGLSRLMATAGYYLFPVGSSSGTQRYRPVEIKPTSASANIFKVRLANVDATTETFDRSIKESTLCDINPYFYHSIWKTSGTDSANIRIYYDNTLDGNYSKITHWQNVPEWENTGLVASLVNPSPTLSYLTKQNWNNYSNSPFALSNEAPIAEITGDTLICIGTAATLTATGGNSYEWDNGSLTPSINVSPTSSATYSVTASNFGCTNTASITVNISNPFFLNAGPDVSIEIGETTQLSATGGNSYFWSPATGLSCTNCSDPLAAPTTTTTYYLTSLNSTGCENKDTLNIFVDAECGLVYVPSAFSPNGNSKNDILYVRGKCISEMTFSVFDRWGEKVFESTDKSIGWDGYYKGSLMNSQVFVYYLTAKLFTGEIKKMQGNITLIR